MKHGKTRIWIGTIGAAVALAAVVIVVANISQPVVGGGIPRCTAQQCKDFPNCQPGGLETDYDTGMTQCAAPDHTIVTCTGGETVHAHTGMCTPVNGCEGAFYIEGPYYCDD